jgi:formate dehydrogenase subunit gamma
MVSLMKRAGLAFAALAIVSLLIFVPSLHAQQNALVDPDASAVNEQTLLQQLPRLEGQIDQPIERARVLVQPAGRQWDHFHEVTLHWFGAIVILGIMAALGVAYRVMGRLRISAGRAGTKVRRFSAFERFTHWLTAVSFIVLGLTGLNITFGKLVLLPLIGADAFSSLSQAAKYIHNFGSFPFVLGWILAIALWLKDNIPGKLDVDWLKQGGGFIHSKHPLAGRFNAGEKLVFWGVFGAGLAVAISGYLLLFPFYVTNIAGMQIAQVVHSIIAILFVALILGHIYIGTLGTEGAFEAMESGEVDLNWAKQHHSLWLEDEIAKGRVPPPAAPASVNPAE